MRSLGALILVLVTAACGPLVDGSYKGAPLASLQGTMSLAPGTALDKPVRLAIAWYPVPNFAGTDYRKAIATDELTYSGDFPQNFQFDIFAPPPPEAMGDASSWGLPGHLSYGFLVAYLDGNGNGRLDVTPEGATPVDQVLAFSGAGTSDQSFYIQYYESVTSTEPDFPTRFSRFSFNHGSEGLQDWSKPVNLTLDRSADLDWYLCQQVLTLVTAPDGPCKHSAELKAFGVVQSVSDHTHVAIQVMDASFPAGVRTLTDAAVQVNGHDVPWDSTERRNAIDAYPNYLTEGQSAIVNISAPYFPSLLPLQATIPGAFNVQPPATGLTVAQGAMVRLSWSPSAGAVTYAVVDTISDDPLMPPLQHENDTQDTAIDLKAPNIQGHWTVQVQAINYPLNPTGDSLLLGINERDLEFTVQ